ncbi:MAG TPA: glycosyl hydrolase, partial [Lacunisphaera sp.]
MKTRRAFFALLTCIVFAGPLAAEDTVWPTISRENKPWTRWWWLGSAVDKPNLTRELEALAAAGFGGVEVTPIYGAKGYESRFVPFLSPQYVDLLAHTGAEAKRLGLAVDMATGTGWPFGGPGVTAEDAELKVAFGPDGRIAPVPTKFKVKRSAPGGEGWVLNPFSATALEHYLAPFTKALAALPAGTIHGQFHDSFEYEASWANEVPAKFQAMHGYDLRDHAAELAGQGDPDTVARIKADYRTTLGELHLDYVRAWVAWTKARGEISREQAHGSPGNLLDLYAAADIPETEIFGSIPFPIPGFRREAAEIGRPGHPPIIHHFASSAAHVTGKPYASSETFTWLREHFHESPSEMKPELDALFLAGINHIFYHGDAYSPEDAPWPGWLFYASSQLNTRNPLWRDLGDGLNAYITRAQSLLQAGQPDNDLLIYWPVDDLWHNPEGLRIQLTVHADWLERSATGQMMNDLTNAGYSYDLISDAQLQLLRVENHMLKAPGGSYATIIVPKTEHMPLETLQRLLALANDGAAVIFFDSLPADVPGFGSLDKRRSAFQAELARLKWEEINRGSVKRIANVGRGGVTLIENAGSYFKTGTVQQRETMTDAGLRFIRRKLDDGYIYFIANQTAQPFEGWIALTRAAQGAVQMNPRRGEAGVAAIRQNRGVTEVFLQQAPGESIFIRTFTNRAAIGDPIRYTQPAGDPIAIGADWKVTATRGGPELPPSFVQHGFGSWTAQGGEWERFAGTARYETEFEIPAGVQADDWLLDLGDVRETARVFINGTETDLVWSLPMRTKIGAFLKSGKNTLALEITNLAANRIRDLDRRKVEWKKFHEINFVNIFYQSFNAADWPL